MRKSNFIKLVQLLGINSEYRLFSVNAVYCFPFVKLWCNGLSPFSGGVVADYLPLMEYAVVDYLPLMDGL